MSTEGEGDEKGGNSVRMQRVHARTTVLIIEDIEDSALKLLAGYWAVPSANNKGDQLSQSDDQRRIHTSRQLSHNTAAQGVESAGKVGYKARKSTSRMRSP
jgi:hypothetical protein